MWKAPKDANELKTYDATRTHSWVKQAANLDKEDAEIFRKMKLDGQTILKVTEQRLTDQKFPLGSAMKIMTLLEGEFI